jgi:hypothetical protein
MHTDHLVARLLAAYNRHDAGAAAVLYAEDARHVEMSSGRGPRPSPEASSTCCGPFRTPPGRCVT